jgi:hypothetical protein
MRTRVIGTRRSSRSPRGHRGDPTTFSRRLDDREQGFINFRDFDFDNPGDHGYRWVDLKHFGFSSGSSDDGDASDDRRLLAALIADVRFRDDYAGGGVEPAGTRHGPYWLDRVSVDAYRPVDEATADGILCGWACRYGTVPGALRDRLEREVHALVRAATGRYLLRDLGESEFHDWGGVHGEFHELVLVDRTARTLTLIVAADD